MLEAGREPHVVSGNFDIRRSETAHKISRNTFAIIKKSEVHSTFLSGAGFLLIVLIACLAAIAFLTAHWLNEKPTSPAPLEQNTK